MYLRLVPRSLRAASDPQVDMAVSLLLYSFYKNMQFIYHVIFCCLRKSAYITNANFNYSIFMPMKKLFYLAGWLLLFSCNSDFDEMATSGGTSDPMSKSSDYAVSVDMIGISEH